MGQYHGPIDAPRTLWFDSLQRPVDPLACPTAMPVDSLTWRNNINRTRTVSTALLAAMVLALSNMAAAQSNAPVSSDAQSRSTAAHQQKKAQFAEQEETLQKQSRSSASGSPRVDKSVQAADPVAKPTTKQEKKAAFAEQEATYQQRSRSSASGSPRADKAVAADPVPKATTKPEKKARFTAQEKELQRDAEP